MLAAAAALLNRFALPPRVEDALVVMLVALATPSTGVVKVGDVESTTLPDPVEVMTPVPPFATGSVPVTPLVNGNPVALVSTTALGVPSVGVVKVGLVARTGAPVPVAAQLSVGATAAEETTSSSRK
jgi:hypothetical protein